MYEGSYLLDKKEGYGEYTWVINKLIYFILRRMGENIWECGKRANKKDKEILWEEMAYKEKVFGEMEVEFSGWKNDYCFFL